MSEYQDYGYQSALRSYNHDYILRPLLQQLHPDRNKKILDMGCGNGAITSQLLTSGFDIYGTDASVQGISHAKKLHPERFFIQDFNETIIPFELAHIPFDVILAIEVIEHLYDPRQFLKHCKTILQARGGGDIIITTPYHGYLKNLALSFTNNWDGHMNPLWHGGHIKLWSKKTLTKLLEEEGFKVTKFQGCGRFPYFWKSMMIKSKLVI